ncbi:MAG: MBL fold metallo-hydrolase [Saprospiraceae bacterium]|nr:MBL fold metallo-hydrolase [Saprospiraceae bacterium]
MKITFLGTGTSQGVPVIGCKCKVCSSTDPRDKRLRCAMYIETEDTRIIIDTGPDFRQQLLNNQIQDIDAILYTHEHKDHVAGLDDVRPINFLQRKDMPLYAEERVILALEREFHYAFSENKYPGVPRLLINKIDEQPFFINKTPIIPIRVMHHRLPILGFRIHDFAYITDANFIAEQELEKLKNLDVLVLNALRFEKHISHFTLSEAVELVQKLQPKKAYLTHISHLMDRHETINKHLPANIHLAFDGFQFQL